MTHEERVLKHEYSLEGIHEHAERIAKLEELVLDMWTWWFARCGDACERNDDYCGFGPGRECYFEREIADRMDELGVVE